jgi:MFS family permease
MSKTLDYETPAGASGPGPLPGARLSLTLLLLINMFNYIDRQVLAAVEPSIAKTFFSSHDKNVLAKMGLLSTAFILSYMIAAPLFGWIADRTSRWLLVGVSVLLWSFATAGSGLAWTFGVLLCTRLFVGIGEAGYGPAAPTIISDLYPVARRGSVLAWFYVAIPVGSALGYVIGGAVGNAFGWRLAFYVVTVPGLLLGIWSLFMKDPPRGAHDGGVTHGLPRLADYLHLLKIRSFVLNTLAMAAMTFAIGGISYWMPHYLIEARHMTGNSTTMFGGITVVAGLGATILGGLAGDNLRSRYGGSYFLVSGVGILIAVPFTLAMLWTPFPFAWVMIFGAVFFLFFNTGPSNTALANVVNPAVRASAFAINIFVIHAIGDAPSPPILGWIADKWGWNASFGVVAACMALAGVLWLIGTPHLKADTDAVAGIGNSNDEIRMTNQARMTELE